MTKDRTLSTSIHILCVLGVLKNEFVSSAHLAKSLQTNPGFVRRMLLKLSENGLIVTTKGIGGGSKLARPANQITLDEIYTAVSQGPIFGTFEKEPYQPCSISRSMGGILKDVYADIDYDLQKSLKKIKLSEIIKKIH